MASLTEVYKYARSLASKEADHVRLDDFPQVAMTALDSDTTLVTSTTYGLNSKGSNVTCTLPAAASCKRGDIIKIVWAETCNNGDVIKIKPADSENFCAGSRVTFQQGTGPGGAGRSNTSVEENDGTTSKRVLTSTSATNGDGGAGSYVDLCFTGSRWSMLGHMAFQGAGTINATTSFGAT